MSNSAAARVKRRRTGEEDVVDEDAGDKHPNCSSICLVTLSEKLRFLSDKNYDAFGANHVTIRPCANSDWLARQEHEAYCNGLAPNSGRSIPRPKIFNCVNDNGP